MHLEFFVTKAAVCICALLLENRAFSESLFSCMRVCLHVLSLYARILMRAYLVCNCPLPLFPVTIKSLLLHLVSNYCPYRQICKRKYAPPALIL